MRRAPRGSSRPQLPLQFGIEIECFVAALTSEHTDEDHTALDKTHQHLNKVHGLKCENTRDVMMNKRYRTWEIIRDPSLRVRRTEAGMQEHYQKGCDYFNEDASISIGCVEVTSPPLPALSLACAGHSQQIWTREVHPYFKALTSQVERAEWTDRYHKEPDFIPYTTKACGFHIHIGLRDSLVLPLPVLKHLAILCLIYEPIINTLHPPHRTAHEKNEGYRWCDSNRTAFRPNGHSCQDHLLIATDINLRVNHCNTVQDLVYIMGTCEPAGTKRHVPCDPYHRDLRFAKHRVVNWSNLTDPRGTRTIEFRQSARTLDSTHAAFTVQLYIALVRAAERRANLAAAGLPREEQEEIGTHHGLFTALDLCAETDKYWRDRAAECSQSFAREVRQRWPPSYRNACGSVERLG